ncbi:hypothetical protein CBR_g38831 [Chara braunii]|uniref:Endonuclease/exonuclease/phosphatase domain-containing protein n=1 Tax=Chara braunii TaxID=69332 RepID=A0A388LQL4_CHABU|nr:hypothetical protein CBR_g38831 [Chara braunii]|eukprot:GBG84549.1 hypothetical protein CBR_g38831 [Chara braunii]
MCFDDGVYPTEIDPGEMVVQGREVRFKLNTSLDEIEVKWPKERTVMVIYKEAARFLAKNIKDDLARAFEDGWIVGNSDLQENTRRGRLKIEGPGVASYVARAREVAEYMKTEGQVEITLGADTYKILFKPWMTRAEFRELRRQEEDKMFWVMALQVPLDDMPFIYAQIERVIGKIILAHPTDADPSRPALVNGRFDLELEARSNMKEVLWVETAKGDVLEIKLACSETLKCRKCRQFFHTEQDCRRGGGTRFRGGGTAQSGFNQTQQQAPAGSSNGGNQGLGYQGPLGPRPGTLGQNGGATHPGQVCINPTFSPQGTGGGHHLGGGMKGGTMGGGGAYAGMAGTSGMAGRIHAGQLSGGQNNGGGLGYMGMPQSLGGQNGQAAMWQGGAAAEWILANGFHPTFWQGMLGGPGMIPTQGQEGGGAQQTWGIPSGIPNPQGNQRQPTGIRLPLRPQPLFGARQEEDVGRSRQADRGAETSLGRSKSRTPGKQRRLSTTSQLELTPEPSGDSRLSRSGSEKSITQEGGLGTPGQKTTRDRRLATAKGQSTELAQYIVPLVCTTIRNMQWVITWQKGAEPWLIFGHAVPDMPNIVDIEKYLKILYLDAFPMRVIPDVVMPRILFGPTDNKIKFYVPLIDARLTEGKLTELEALGLRLVPLVVFAEARKQELVRLMVSPLMITADALAEVKGFGDTSGRCKRARVKTWIHENKVSVACFQETKLNNDKISTLGRWWDGPQIWAAARGTKGGVGILIHRSLDAVIEDYYPDLWGRWVWVVLSQGEFRWAVASVYAPVERKERCSFLEELRVSLPDVDEVVIGGDWNMVLDTASNQRTNGCPKDVLAMVDLMADLDLHDVYRDLNLMEEGYTWFSHRGKGRRLDYLLAGGRTREKVISIAEGINPISDHKPVIGSFKFRPDNPRGRGYFKLNTINLKDMNLKEWTQE